MYKPVLTLTANDAKSALEAGLRAIRAGQASIDLADVTAVDSSAVAILLAWQRAARREGKVLTLNNLPAGLRSLAELYGVAELLHHSMAAESRADLPHH